MKLASHMWVAVIDGSKGLILVNEGTALEPRLAVRKTYNQTNPPSHEQGDDRPGRMNDAVGNHKSSMEAPDLHQRAEDEFVAAIIGELEQEAAAGSFEKIIIVAPPVAIGTLRKGIGANLKKRIVKEITADLVKMPLPDIAKAVQRSLES